jgi:steroid delta-isomerase-like uncharacterized protein
MKSKTLLISTLLTLIISARAYCQSTPVINAHFDALIKHDVKAIASGYADTAKVFSPNWEGAKIGPAGLTETYNRYFASTPDLSYKVNRIINAGNEVIVQFTQSGTLSNPESGTPDYMKGKKYTLDCCAIFSVKDTKIVGETDYFDQVAFLRQVGFFDQH